MSKIAIHAPNARILTSNDGSIEHRAWMLIKSILNEGVLVKLPRVESDAVIEQLRAIRDEGILQSTNVDLLLTEYDAMNLQS